MTAARALHSTARSIFSTLGYEFESEPLSAATLDEHEGDTMHEHQFVNVLSPSCPSEVALWSSWWRRRRHSDVTSVTAARAEDSSTIDLFSAKAATRDCTARLLTARGRPRDTWWTRARASSENSVSVRPAIFR